MSNNPLNLGLRFLLEMAALVSIGLWGWTQGTGWVRYPLAVGIPLTAALVWGVFRVPGDASASGRAPVPVPGLVRLLIELALFAFGIWALFSLGAILLSAILGGLVLVHYLLSYDRIAWLLRH